MSITKLAYWERLSQLCLNIFKFNYIEDDKITSQNVLVDENNNEVDYYSINPIKISPIKLNDGNFITHVNLFGDGTIEFQVGNESLAWDNFELKEIKGVINSLEFFLPKNFPISENCINFAEIF